MARRSLKLNQVRRIIRDARGCSHIPLKDAMGDVGKRGDGSAGAGIPILYEPRSILPPGPTPLGLVGVVLEPDDDSPVPDVPTLGKPNGDGPTGPT